MHKFAETNLPWEAYISPKPGQRDRNREIWVETGERLGFTKEIRDALRQSVGSGPQNFSQTNNISLTEKDPRLLARQLGREFKNALG